MTGIVLYNALRKIPELSDAEAKEAVANSEASKFEESSSDVNIATFMLIDCFQKACDVPILLSNASDLSEPLKYIKTILKLPVGLITPVDFWVSKLHKYSSLRRKISNEKLRNSQFSLKLKDNQREFFCSKEWL